jgi:hypothetical protein
MRTFALQPLMEDTPQQGAAVVTKRRLFVRMRLVSMGNIDLEALLHCLRMEV